jgi:hypothetical protein
MRQQQIFAEDVLSKVAGLDIVSTETVGRSYATNTCNFMHVLLRDVSIYFRPGGNLTEREAYHQSPRPRKKGMISAIGEHHTWDNLDIMLPSMPQLMTPFLLNDLTLINLINFHRCLLALPKNILWKSCCSNGTGAISAS